MSRPADISIVTVNWKVAGLVGELLGSIAANREDLELEVFVVDNDSRDNIESVVADFRSRSDLRVTLIKNERNLGFAKANNQALRRCSGRIVALLNPDARVTKGALKRMVELMRERPDVGIMGPALFNPDGTSQESIRRNPGLLDQSMILLKLLHVWPSAFPFRRFLAKDFDYGREQEAEQLMGAALFIRRKVIESVGLLDERFFIWFEEVDYCKRAKEAGWGVVYVPEVKIIHHLGASFAQAMTLKKQAHFISSMSKYFRKHHGAWTLIVLALPMFIGLMAASAFSLWKSVKSRL